MARYAERGFAIDAPMLRELSLDHDHLQFKFEKGWYSDHDLGSDGWNKWTTSSNLERLLMAASMQRDGFTAIEKPFPGRMRNEESKSRDVLHPLRFKMLLNPGKCVSDTYPSFERAKSDGQPIWPATSQLSAFGQDGTFKVTWKEGNMPRMPMLWVDWSKGATTAADRKAPYDWKASAAKRKKEKEAEEAKAAAEIEDRISAARTEAEAHSLCSVCQDNHKDVVLDPCKHFCLCSKCADQLTQPDKKIMCPICRRGGTGTRVYS